MTKANTSHATAVNDPPAITRWLAVACIASLEIPLLYPSLPPLTDLPGHIGRYHILLEIDAVPALRRYFEVRWRLVPNLGVDLLVMALAPLLGVERATSAIVAMIPVMSGAGFLLIARAVHGRIPPTALFALPLAFHYPFQFGFVNFSLSMALAMLSFALWLHFGATAYNLRRTICFSIIGLLLWICHLYGWATLCVVAFASAIVQHHLAGKRPLASGLSAARDCLPLGLPLVLMVLWRQQGVSATLEWFDFHRYLAWSVAIFRDRWEAFDVASALVVFSLLAAAIVKRRSFNFKPQVAFPAAILLLLAFLLPNVLFGSGYAGVRLIPFGVALAVISINVRAGCSKRLGNFILVAAITFLFVRTAGQSASYAIEDHENRQILSALQYIPRESKIVTLVAQRCNSWSPARYVHLPELATVRKDAFTNGHWAVEGAQILDVRYTAGAPYVHDWSQVVSGTGCGTRFPSTAEAVAKIPWPAFDYLWIIGVAPVQWPRSVQIKPIWHSGDAVLYRIDHTSGY